MILQKYEQGKISISKTAQDLVLTIEEIEEHMVKKGCKSKYSSVDMEREMESLMA